MDDLFKQINKLKITGANLQLYISCSLYGISDRIERLVIPEGIHRIREGEIKSIRRKEYKLKEIILPDSLVEIEEEAFVRYKNLERVQLGSGIRTIGRRAFEGLKNLKQIEFPKGLVTIEGCAFKNSGLNGKVILPQSLMKIGESVFEGCELDTIDMNNCKVRSLGSCFNRCKVTEVINIPNKVTSLGAYELSWVVGLKRVDFPDSIRVLGNHSLNSLGLDEIDLGNCEITHIVSNFNNCKNLKKIVFPRELMVIGNGCFGGCPNLVEIDLTNTKVRTVSCNSIENSQIKLVKLPNTKDGLVIGTELNEGRLRDRIKVEYE